MDKREIVQEKIINGVMVRYEPKRDVIYYDSVKLSDYYIRTQCDTPYDTLIEITNKCNQACENCFAFCTSKNTGVEMPLSAIKNYIEERKDSKIRISITGGEPFLHSEIDSILGLSEKYPQLNFVINTNGNVIIKDNQIEMLYKNNWLITFSLHGTRNVHNEYCNAESYDKIINNLKRIKGVLRSQIYCVLHNRMTKEDVAHILSLQKEFEIDYVRFIMPRPFGRYTLMIKKEIVDCVLKLTENTLTAGLKNEKSISEFISYKKQIRMSS